MPSSRPRCRASSFCLRKSAYPTASRPTSRHLPYCPESVRNPYGGAVGEVVVPDEVDSSELRLVHAQVVGSRLDHPLLEEHRLGDPERAAVGDPAGRLVGVHPPRLEMGVGDVVAGERRVHQADLELRRLGVGEEGPVIGQRLHPDPEDPAVLAQRQLAVEVDVPGEPGGDQVPGAVLDPLHRALQQDRRQDRGHIARVDRHLVAEPAAEVRGDDADHVLGQLGDQCHRRPDDVRSLGGHVDGQLRRRPVEVGDRAAALQRRRVRARVVQVELRDDVGLGEGPVGAFPVAHLPVVHDVVRLVLLVVPDQRGVLGQPLHRIDDHRQRLVVDDDRLAGVLGDVGVVGDDAGHLLALEAHLVGGEYRLGVVGQGGHPRQVARRHHLAGEHEADTGHRPRLAGVDRVDPGVGERAAEDLHVQHPGQHDVVDVVALAADEAVVLHPPAAGAHAADLDLVERLGHLATSDARIPVMPWPCRPPTAPP